MVSIVVPQPHRPTASTAESPVSENGDDVLSFSVSNVSAERIALVTPRIQPLEPLTSPLTLPGKLEKTAGVSVSVPDAAMPSDQPPAKPAVASKGKYYQRTKSDLHSDPPLTRICSFRQHQIQQIVCLRVQSV